MRKKSISIVIGILLLLAVGVFAAEEGTEEIQTNSSVSNDVQKYVENFAKERGIESEKIKNVSEVNFEDLPKEVAIENVGDHNLDIYEINYEDVAEEKKLFVVTYSTEKLNSQGDLIIAHDKRQFLNFGFGGETDQSRFLQSATGIEGSLERGYIMMREGSITGISTNLEITNSEELGQVEILIYKNGELTWFGNSISASSLGVQKDYDTQSKGTVRFEPGDVISVYAETDSGVVWKDAITLVEIITEN